MLLLPVIGGAQENVKYYPDVFRDIKHDTSPALRNIPTRRAEGLSQVIPVRPTHEPEAATNQPDPVLQTSAGAKAATTAGLNFDGVGANGFAPPDTNGAVGATQFVQWVNVEFAVYDKSSGKLVTGPSAGNSLWTGFGGQCEAHNDGDPIAQYDKAAGRWVLAQPVYEQPYTYCIAVSTTSDATGTYNRYAFPMPNFPDYPKLGVWPDAYYGTFNLFNGNSFLGAYACAFDRASMLTGAAATEQCFQAGSSFGSLLPSDLDGSTAPPSGSPDFFLNFGSNSLNLWKFHVDFANSANSTFTGPTNLSVASFSETCGGGACVPQLGTKQQLDSLADRLMYRLAYRNISGTESLVVNHSVATSTGGRHGSVSGSGIRWYELRNPNGAPTVYQQATFAPDSNYRWMGSIAMDKNGDIAVGYSVSSSQINPEIHYTGRLATDALNTLESESTIINGTGSQTKSLNRWGDYSSMSIDPVDDCTFWYTNEYLVSNGTFNWNTRIASFKFSGCK
jgi:hypothetical protein